MSDRKVSPEAMGRARFSLWLILFFSALTIAAESRLTLSPYMDYSYSNNIFWDMTRIGDSTFSPGLGLDLNTGFGNFFLDADGKVYQNNDYLNSSMVTGGFSLFKVFSSRTSMFLSPDLSLTRFQGDLSLLDMAVPSITLGLKHSFSNTFFSRLILSLRHSNYLNEDSYDRVRLSTSLELSRFFTTQTTVRLTLGMNYLFFPHIVIQVPASVATVSLPSQPAVIASTEPRQRRGDPAPSPPTPPVPPSPPQPPTPPLPPAPPAPPDPLPAEETSLVSTTLDLAIPQPYVILRVAQGLGFKTGIVAEFMFRKNQTLLQGMQAIGASEWALEQTDEDFFWQGTRVSIGLKTEFIKNLEVSLDLSFSKKQYQGIDALDLEGVPVQPLAFRSDSLAQASLRLSRKFGSVGLFIAGSYRKNHSNDLYFQYDFFTISGGVDLSI